MSSCRARAFCIQNEAIKSGKTIDRMRENICKSNKGLKSRNNTELKKLNNEIVRLTNGQSVWMDNFGGGETIKKWLVNISDLCICVFTILIMSFDAHTHKIQMVKKSSMFSISSPLKGSGRIHSKVLSHSSWKGYDDKVRNNTLECRQKRNLLHLWFQGRLPPSGKRAGRFLKTLKASLL